MSFKTDLATGLKAEDWVVAKLKEEFPTLKRVEEGKLYDLKDDNGFTIEVKYDRLSERTPNIGIEYLYNGEPSGISTTKAIEWVQIFYLDGEWLYSRNPVDKLRSFIRCNWDCLDKVDAGDGLRAKIVLIRKDDFANNFHYYEVG